MALTAWTLDARYRGYFGSDELKTFFDAGLSPRLAAGPRIGLGVAYDLDRAWGLFASLGASTAFGGFRGFGLGLGVGVQFRWHSREVHSHLSRGVFLTLGYRVVACRQT